MQQHRPRFGMQKPARRHCLRAGSFYPGLLAEEGNDTVEEIADGGDDVLDLAGEGRDLILRAGQLLERVLHGLHPSLSGWCAAVSAGALLSGPACFPAEDETTPSAGMVSVSSGRRSLPDRQEIRESGKTNL